jgi:YVTN family beta-propeller protein
VAVDPGTRTVYVTNVGLVDADTVSVIDGSTRTVTAKVPVGKNPEGVAVDPGKPECRVCMTRLNPNALSCVKHHS